MQEFIAIPDLLEPETQRSLTTQEARNAIKARREQDPDLSLYDAIIGRNRRQINGFDNPNVFDEVNAFNKQQSTHTTSVNKSAAGSIKKLGNLYGTQVTSIEVDIILEEILENIETFILNFEKDKIYKENNPKSTDIFLADNILQAAKRCIEELKLYKAISRYRYYEASKYYEASNNSRYYELVLVWRAIHDDNKRIGSLEDAKKQIIIGLYEIQRGNNIDR